MKKRSLAALLVAMVTVSGPGCVPHGPYGITRGVAVAQGDGDHDHEPEGPITSELQARADRVLVLQGGAERPTEVIGLIDEHGRMGQEDEALARLRRDAARMGGDAIIHVEFHHAGDQHHEEGDEDHAVDEGAEATSFGGEREIDPDVDADTDEGSDPLALHLSGTVVRFRDLVSGHHFRVIQRIVVHVPMTHEEDGLAELQREARALHADLLMNVEFHHGHGSEPLEVDGTAVRFVP